MQGQTTTKTEFVAVNLVVNKLTETGASRLRSNDRSLGARICTIDRNVEYLKVLYETGLCQSIGSHPNLPDCIQARNMQFSVIWMIQFFHKHVARTVGSRVSRPSLLYPVHPAS
eukprot:scaffold46160_cov42-Cyclotella_meneghiniana.AAC.1